MQSYRWIGVVLFICGLPKIAAAGDPTLCEARHLAQESRLHKCLSRCVQRDERRVGFDVDACEGLCQASFDAAIARLDDKRVCSDDTDDADPNLCEAQLLKIEARHLFCNVRCARRADRRTDVDEEVCDAGCAEGTEAAMENILDKPICAEGRM